MTLTVEQVSRLLTDRFGVFMSAAGVDTNVQNEKLKRVPRDQGDRRQSKVGWRVSQESVVTYLQGKGFSDEEIRAVLS